MRRMYSEQELTKIIKEVSEAYISELIEEGEFDDDIASYVDAYLVEHPVDITALEGQTIAPAVVNATTSISAPSIIEVMNGYSWTAASETKATITPIYVGAVKNGNKLTLVAFYSCVKVADATGQTRIGRFNIPNAVSTKIVPAISADLVAVNKIPAVKNATTLVDMYVGFYKYTEGQISLVINDISSLTAGETYYLRQEITFLLSDSLAS